MSLFDNVKPIPDWESYGITKDGLIYRIGKAKGAKVGKQIKPHLHTKIGYLTVRLYQKDKQKTFDVHRLVAITYFGEIPFGMDVCHKNGIKTDCRLDNLRVGSKSSNEMDKIDHGTSNRGERNGNNKYSESLIKTAKNRIAAKEDIKEISQSLGINIRHLKNIKNGYKWKWL